LVVYIVCILFCSACTRNSNDVLIAGYWFESLKEYTFITPFYYSEELVNDIDKQQTDSSSNSDDDFDDEQPITSLKRTRKRTCNTIEKSAAPMPSMSISPIPNKKQRYDHAPPSIFSPFPDDCDRDLDRDFTPSSLVSAHEHTSVPPIHSRSACAAVIRSRSPPIIHIDSSSIAFTDDKKNQIVGPFPICDLCQHTDYPLMIHSTCGHTIACFKCYETGMTKCPHCKQYNIPR
jgi:hypothetical protein